MYEAVWREHLIDMPSMEGVHGATVLVWGGEVASHICRGCTVVDSEERAHQELETESHTHVVYILESASEHTEDLKAVGACLRLVQAVAAMPVHARPKVWLVTRGAQGPDGSQPYMSLTGLVRAVQFEAGPGLRCACVDIDPALDAEAAGLRLYEEISASKAGVWENEV